MSLVIYFIVILVGSVFGSFVGALTYRLPRGLGIVYGRSFCDNCKKPLGWIHNIPVFSYLVQRGLSSCCHKKLSIRYFLIESFSAFAAFYLYINYAPLEFLVYFVLFLLVLSVLVIDVEHQYIEDYMSWLILGLAITFGSLTVFESLFAGFAMSLILLFLHLLTRGRGMGLGDVKLAIALGSWFSPINSLYWLFGAFLTGGLVAFILLLTGKAELKQKIAFGPFLIISFMYVLLFR
jgi:leader peptidase (prepilin peptidase)/N-methyltransferase